MRFTIVLTPEADGSAFNVTVPALPGCLTWGATFEEAIAFGCEAIALHLEGFAERGEPYPVETSSPQLAMVDVDPVRLAS